MAQFFKAKPKSRKGLSRKLKVVIERLDHKGAGIAQHQGKVVFVAGALVGEKVEISLTEVKSKYAKGQLLNVIEASSHRINPLCPHYQECGGCDMQHLNNDQQQQAKQASLESLMDKYSQMEKVPLSPVIAGSDWGYRRRARLSLKPFSDATGFHLGFRASASERIIDISECPVMDASLAAMLTPLRQTFEQFDDITRVGHVELLQAGEQTVLILRQLKPFLSGDKALLAELADRFQVGVIFRDNQGGHHGLAQAQFGLSYPLPRYDLNLAFAPNHFIQVNEAVNQRMVEQALQWLDIQAGERVLDLFCGVGNFTLALAKQAPNCEVIGVEGVVEMVAQARANAELNGVDNCFFYHEDLSDFASSRPWLQKVDKLLLDPARAGAGEVLEQLKKMEPKAIVYVSCNPASLARDCQILAKQGYRLKKLGLVDMFPQTHHLESMALLEKKG
ncbi:23S rRNA (uracil(1939)-C(5))-methyltransferase RlmD [Paraferrimonas haliotis]|uniref:23S rRNA (uracil(1939)-C(5))-methyltransferase RlmD n=1 Tax=Paraferrimonas haliotis TaxID=2013866 RepID=A0AA37WVP9_9GAMM|nr:23S rRNA (uracil(1939)-C(5))-methyltransferase RlmD [Paraferrimonas haliotis]GLS82833.1 23S rRNA (uracil(1939)-C(5))-methyltransferase RlmD [Paraferrimonas haliotis]